MMESATYRQGTKAENPKGNEIDPENRLVWRQTMRRLDAESMHDTVLAADGRLNLEMGGRGYFPELPKELLATQSIPAMVGASRLNHSKHGEGFTPSLRER